VERWKRLKSDPDAKFDMTVELNAKDIAPQVTWGTNPGMVSGVTARVPEPSSFADLNDQKATERALQYMGLKAGTPIVDISIDRVFIGSCTNSRIDDLRAAAHLVAGKHVARSIKQALVVPGSRGIKTATTPIQKSALKSISTSHQQRGATLDGFTLRGAEMDM